MSTKKGDPDVKKAHGAIGLAQHIHRVVFRTNWPGCKLPAIENDLNAIADLLAQKPMNADEKAKFNKLMTEVVVETKSPWLVVQIALAFIKVVTK